MSTTAVCQCTTFGTCDLCRGPIVNGDTAGRIVDLTPISQIDPFPIPEHLATVLDSPQGKSALHRLAKALHTDDWTAFKAIRFFLWELQSELVE